MINYVFNLSNNSSSINDVDRLDDVNESLEQLVGYRARSRPPSALLPLQTGRTIDCEHIDLDEESPAKAIQNLPHLPGI